MKIILLIILISLSSYSKVDINLVFPDEKVPQGSMINVELQIINDDGNFDSTQLENKSFGDSLYFHKAEKNLATVIIFDEPKGEIVGNIERGDIVNFKLVNFHFQKTDAGNEMIFEDFQISNDKYLIYSLIFIIAGFLLSYVYFLLKKKNKIKNEKKRQQINLKEKIFSAKKYEDIVEIWKTKNIYFSEFPVIQDQFQKFELILFKYMFKPQINEVEKIEVLESFKKFQRNIESYLNGI